MAITTSTLIEDSFKTIIKSNGQGSEEDQILINSAELQNASSAPKISIANLYYEVLGTGNVTVFFKNDEEKKVTLELSVYQAAAIRQSLFADTKLYTYGDACPERVYQIREAIVQIDNRLGEILKEE